MRGGACAVDQVATGSHRGHIRSEMGAMLTRYGSGLPRHPG